MNTMIGAYEFELQTRILLLVLMNLSNRHENYVRIL